jgi:hypothetical protein
MGDFVGAVGGWWSGAVLLLPGIAAVASINRGGLTAGFLGAVGMLLVLVGAYRAYHRIAQERDELQARLEPDGARFTINAAVPYAAIPPAYNSLTIPDVSVINWSDAPLKLRFTLLAADGSGPLANATTTPRTASAGTVLANPMHLDPYSSRNGRLGWRHGDMDPTQYVIAGVVLRVLDEYSEVCVDIALPTASSGYQYPEPQPPRTATE